MQNSEIALNSAPSADANRWSVIVYC